MCGTIGGTRHFDAFCPLSEILARPVRTVSDALPSFTHMCDVKLPRDSWSLDIADLIPTTLTMDNQALPWKCQAGPRTRSRLEWAIKAFASLVVSL